MADRFDSSVGIHYTPEFLCDLSDEELAAMLREENDGDLIRDLLWRADLLDEYEALEDYEGREGWDIIYKAAEKLGVAID